MRTPVRATASAMLLGVSLFSGAVIAAPVTDGVPPAAQVMRAGPLSMEEGERQLETLQSRLELTGKQEPAWQRYRALREQQQRQMRELAEANRRHPPATAPERVERHIEMARTQVRHLEAMKPVVTALYTQLTPAQQTIFDEKPALPSRQP